MTMTPAEIEKAVEELKMKTSAEQDRLLNEGGAIHRVVVRGAGGNGFDVWEVNRPIPDPLGRAAPPQKSALDSAPLVERRSFYDGRVVAIFLRDERKYRDGEEEGTIPAHVEIYVAPWGVEKPRAVKPDWTLSPSLFGLKVKIPLVRVEEISTMDSYLALLGQLEEESGEAPAVEEVAPETSTTPPAAQPS